MSSSMASHSTSTINLTISAGEVTLRLAELPHNNPNFVCRRPVRLTSPSATTTTTNTPSPPSSFGLLGAADLSSETRRYNAAKAARAESKREADEWEVQLFEEREIQRLQLHRVRARVEVPGREVFPDRILGCNLPSNFGEEDSDDEDDVGSYISSEDSWEDQFIRQLEMKLSTHASDMIRGRRTRRKRTQFGRKMKKLFRKIIGA